MDQQQTIQNTIYMGSSVHLRDAPDTARELADTLRETFAVRGIVLDEVRA